MANPTAQEQELLELINRMRLNPQAELQILLDSSDPTNQSYNPAVKGALDYFKVNRDTLKTQWTKLQKVAPVAWSSELNQSAKGHNQAMIDGQQQSHQVNSTYGGKLIKEADLGERTKAAGYDFRFVEENTYAYANSIFYAHAAFAIDWGSGIDGIQDPAGHRNALVSNRVREVGISVVEETDPDTEIGDLVITQNFGNRSALDNKAWLLGVAFQDKDGDNFYDAGEGLRDVTVKITGTNFSKEITVGNAGGYQELLDPGQYQVDFIREGNTIKQINTSVGANVKLDLVIPVITLDPNPSTPTPTLTPTSTVNLIAPTDTKGTGNSQQVTAPVDVSLKTSSSANNFLDFRTDNSTTGTTQDLTDKTIEIKFTSVNAYADYSNYGGFYRVEDTKGTVQDIDGKYYLPGSSGYTTAALRRAQVNNEGVEINRDGLGLTTNLKGGYIYAPFMIENASINDVLNSKNSAKTPHVYFDYLAANTDGVMHTKSLGSNKFGFEDLYGGGDKDYNDLIFQVNAKVV